MLTASMPAIVASQQVAAQDITASVRGQVVDAEGRALANAGVRVVHVPSGTTAVFTTDYQGGFLGRGLRPGGPYLIEVAPTATTQGARLENVFLNVGQTLPVRLETVSLGAIEEIVVTGQAISGLGAGGGSTSYGVDDIASMASVNRDFKDTLRRNPFVTVGNGSGDPLRFSGAGARFNNLTVDGIRQGDDFGLNASGVPTQRTPISIDAIGEVSANPAPFSVEFGRFQGGSINITTKSGTNEFRGSGFWARNDDSTAGRNNRQDDLDLNFTEEFYGGTLGGPLVKDKLFFFMNYEKFNGTSPTNDGPAGSGRPNTTDAVTLADVDLVTQIASEVFNFDSLGLPPDSLDVKDEKVFAKIDWNISDDHRAFVSYQRTAGNLVVPTNNRATFDDVGLLSTWYNRKEKLTAVNVGAFSNWTDAFNTEFKFGRKEVRNRQVPFGDNDFGNFRVSLPPGPGEIFFGPDIFRQANLLDNDTTQVKLKGDYFAGNHVITIGGELDRLSIFNLFLPRSQGEFFFNSIEDLAARRASQLIFANAVSGDVNDAAADFSVNVWTAYLQDRWTPIPELTLTAGLRADVWGQGAKPAFNQNFVDRNGFDNRSTLDGKVLIQPRFEAVYDLDARTRLRGGIGLFGGGDPTVWVSNAFSNDGITTSQVSINRSNPDAALVAAALDNVNGFDIPQVVQDRIAAGNGPVDAVDPNFKVPSNWKLNAAIERDLDLGPLGDGYFFSVEAILSRVRDAANWVELRREVVGTAPDGSPIFSTESGFDLLLTNTGKGKSDAIAFAVGKKWEELGLSFDGSYTWQNVVDVNPATNAATSAEGFRAETDGNNPNDRLPGRSVLEVKNTFKANLVWQKEFYKDYKTTLSAFYTGRSGAPFSFVFDDGGRPRFGGNSSIDNRNRNLFFVPEAGDPNVILQGISPAELEDFIKRNGLEKFRGENVTKGHAQAPWQHRLDLHAGQEVPFVYGRLEFFADMKNALNFISKSLGRIEEPPGGRGDEGKVPVANVQIVDDDGTQKFQISNLRDPRLALRSKESVWVLQFGARWRF